MYSCISLCVTDKQHELGDPVSLEGHYRKPKERLAQYDHLLRNLLICAQKEYLHGVGIVKVGGGVVRSCVAVLLSC